LGEAEHIIVFMDKMLEWFINWHIRWL
jgi:hypothetical protein